MARKTGRLALVGAALLTLGILGSGTAMAASPAAARAAAGPLEKITRHIVHGTVVVQKRDGTLQTLQIDRGTIASISGGSITISEPGGSQVVGTDAQTRVRKGGAKSSVAQLAVGDRVAVVSEVRGGTAVARLVLVPRPRPATLPAQTTP
jgi:hypothetical protein